MSDIEGICFLKNIDILSSKLKNIIKENEISELDRYDAQKSFKVLNDKLNTSTFEDDKTIKRMPEFDLGIGSFFKDTQIKPLNDIDKIFSLSFSNYEIFTEEKTKDYNQIKIKTKKNIFLDSGVGFLDENNLLNSRLIIESFKRVFQNSRFNRSQISRRKEAVVVNLLSYDWSFDIIPAFYIGEDKYLIPDGFGHWKVTAPKRDIERLEQCKKINGVVVTDVIKLFKIYMEKEGLNIYMNSYILETMILDYYDKNKSEGLFFDFLSILIYIGFYIYRPVFDSKHVDGDINCLTLEQKFYINRNFIERNKVIIIALNVALKKFIIDDDTFDILWGFNYETK